MLLWKNILDTSLYVFEKVKQQNDSITMDRMLLHVDLLCQNWMGLTRDHIRSVAEASNNKSSNSQIDGAPLCLHSLPEIAAKSLRNDNL